MASKFKYVAISAVAAVMLYFGYDAFFYMPNSYHLINMIELEPPKREKFETLVTTRFTSEFIFKSSFLNKAPCDAMYYRNGVLEADENGMMNILINLYNENGVDKKKAEDMVEFLSQRCDVNAKTDEFHLCPLQTAILNKDARIVAILLRNGADINIRTKAHNKELDGLNSIQFAKHYMSKASLADKPKYDEIITMLEASTTH